MSINHHLDDITVMRFAAGQLDEAFGVVVSAHLSMCAECRDRLKNAEQLGGTLLEDISFDANEAADEADSGFDALMAAIDAEPKSARVIRLPKRAEQQKPGHVPTALSHYIGTDLSAIKWKKVAPGVMKYDVAVAKDCPSSLYLLHIAPGMAVPEHGHGGSEITLILSGAYRDEIGEFDVGDIADLDDHHEHQPKVSSDVPCICLAATEKPTRFKGLIPKLMQPFIGI